MVQSNIVLRIYRDDNMAEDAEWDNSVNYKKFLKSARENVELMKARYDGFQVTENDLDLLRSIQNEIPILVIGTDRCDDTAGNVPILAKIAECTPRIELRIIDSDANARYHQQYKVNGKRKTPVVLFLSTEHEELCRWVERPNAAYKVLNEATSPSTDGRHDELMKLYSDPEIQRQCLNEFVSLVLRADFILGRK
ncbi:MAG: thioredoxin family protein [Candidatus Thorarchaeota archaeon]|nr:thioredoxin family protein [Candidatus Thorarchaeota archaeon]